MSIVDVVFVGSSPNALIAATELAGRGAKVVVLETREALGGVVATETFAPGFRVDTGLASATIEPDLLGALGVGVEIVRRDSVTLLGEQPLTLRRAPELPRSFHDAVALLGAIHRMPAPRVPSATPAGAAALGDVAARLLGLGPRAMHEVLRLTFMSIRDYLEENVASEGERTLLAVAALRHLSEGPFAPGTLYPLLHRFATDDALFTNTARGGLGALSEGLGRAARAAGVEVRAGVAAPIRIELESGVATGVRLGDGIVLAAKHVVSDLDARTTFTSLVRPRDLEPEENRAVRAIRHRGTTARVHLALASAPAFAGIETESETQTETKANALLGTLVIADGVAGLERAWDAAKRGKLPARPVLELTVPSLADPGLAPAGQHVLDASVHYVPYGRADKAEVVASVLAALERFDPGIRARVLHVEASLPEDLERRFGVTEGHLEGGEIRLDQAFFLRPFPGHAGHGSPIENLWLGGSAAHPGGYGGRSGKNLATALGERLFR